VAVEEPLEIRVEHFREGRRETRPVAVTMRTPGDDFELAAGFLFSEGILADRSRLREITYCQPAGEQEYNVVSVRLREGVAFDEALLVRNFYTSSSCGVCGKASLEALQLKGCGPLPYPEPGLDPALLATLPERLRAGQEAFRRTGGLHAAGLFTAAGELVALREDVGRHNAVDKVIGRALLESSLPLEGHVLVVSGRTSFEILQKALVARIPAVVAVGAPSSLAVELARRFRITLAGFTRPGGFNLYAGKERVRSWEGERR
jgi:FdhD protein